MMMVVDDDDAIHTRAQEVLMSEMRTEDAAIAATSGAAPGD